MRVTLRLANSKRIARMPPSKTTSKPQPGLYPNNGSDCHLPIHPTLCSGPPHSLYPIPEGGSFPGGPGGTTSASLRALPPPRPSLESWGQEEPVLDFREDSQCWARDTGTPRPVTPACSSSQRTSQKGRAGKEKGGPGTRAALSSPVPSVFLLQ